MSAGTLRHVVENAWARRGDDFAAWFPAVFDWQSLCADAPSMARRVSRGETGDAGESDHEDGDQDEGGLVPELDLVEVAEDVFAHAYVGALVGIALVVDDERDPDLLVERLAEPLSEEEEPRFEALTAKCLEPTERVLAGQVEAPDERNAEAAAALLVEGAWPGVETALEGLPGFGDDDGPELPDEVRQVLAGVARVAAILAAFRWLALTDPG
jgi:hypothetical protein